MTMCVGISVQNQPEWPILGEIRWENGWMGSGGREMKIYVSCSRCGKPVSSDEAEACWYCGAPLCYDCWDTHGHCGHPQAKEMERKIREARQKAGER